VAIFPPPFLSALNICRQKPLTSKCGSTVLQSRWVSLTSYCSCLDNNTTGLDNCSTGLATRRFCTSRRLETIYFRITIAIVPWDVHQEIPLNYFTAPGTGRHETGIITVSQRLLQCMCLSSSYLTLAHMTRSPGPSPSVFAYCKRSKTGGGNSLGTRLPLSNP